MFCWCCGINISQRMLMLRISFNWLSEKHFTARETTLCVSYLLFFQYKVCNKRIHAVMTMKRLKPAERMNEFHALHCLPLYTQDYCCSNHILPHDGWLVHRNLCWPEDFVDCWLTEGPLVKVDCFCRQNRVNYTLILEYKTCLFVLEILLPNYCSYCTVNHNCKSWKTTKIYKIQTCALKTTGIKPLSCTHLLTLSLISCCSGDMFLL